MAIDSSNQASATEVAALWQGLFGTAPPSETSLENFTTAFDLDPDGFTSFLMKTKAFKDLYTNAAGEFKEFAFILSVFRNAGLNDPSLTFIQNQSKNRDGDDLVDFIFGLPSVELVLSAAADDFVQKVVDGDPVTFGASLFDQPVNTAPENITIDNDIYDESTPISASVATLSADDAEGDDVTFTLLNDASVPFTIIDGNTVIVDESLEDADFDDETFILQVQAEDEFGALSDVTEITVTVTDDDEEPQDPPMFINLTPGAETVVGGDNDDTFTGSSSSLLQPSATTADAGDRLFGEGGEDTFFLGIDGPFPVPVDGIFMDSVEIIETTNNSPFDATVQATQFNGTHTFNNSNSQGDLEYQDIQYVDGIEIGFTDPQNGADYTIDFDQSTLPDDGMGNPTGVVRLVLDEVGSANGEASNHDIEFTQNATGPGPTTPAELDELVIESVGPDGLGNFVDDLDVNAMTYTIEGTNDLQLGDEGDNDDDLLDDNDTLMEIQASGLDANLTVNLDDEDNDNANDRAIQYVGAAGMDRLIMGDLFDDGNNSKDNSSAAATLATQQMIDGGLGDNTLVFDNFTAIGPGDDLNGVVKNFETAEFNEEVGDGGETELYADQLDGVRIFHFADGVDDNGDINVIGLDPDETHTFIIDEDNNANTDVDMDFSVGDPQTEAMSGDINGTMDSIVVTLNDDDLDINLTGDEIEMFEFQVLDGSFNEIFLDEPMTDLLSVKVTDLEPITSGQFEFYGNENIVQEDFYYDGSMSAIDQYVEGVNLGVVETGSGDDEVQGTDDDNFIITNDGDDTVEAGEGDDFVDAGAGEDFVDGGRGNDIILGGDGDDELIGGSGDDYIDGGAGKDTMTGGTGLAPFGASPREVKFSVEGLVGLGDEFFITLFHDIIVGSSYTAGAADVGNPGNVAAALAADLIANGAAAEGYTVTAMGNMVTVIRDDGCFFDFDSFGLDGAAADLVGFDTASVDIIDFIGPAIYDADDVISITIDATQYDVIVPADNYTAAQVALDLVALVNGGVQMTASINPVDPTVVDLVGNVQGQNYVVARTVDPNGPAIAGGTNTVDEAGDGIDNAEPTPAMIVIDAQGQFENTGDNFALTIVRADGTGSDLYSITQSSSNFAEFLLTGVPVDTGNDTGAEALANLVAAQGPAILGSLGIPGGSIMAIGDTIKINGPADGSPIPVDPGDVTAVLSDGGPDPIDTLSVDFMDGDQVNDNLAPNVIDNMPAPIQDDSQTVTAEVIDEGEKNGEDTFVIDSPNVDPFDLVGDEIDMVTDFESLIDCLVFDGATVDGFDDNDLSGGVTAGDLLRFFDAGSEASYAAAFISANSAMMADPTVDYVAVEVAGDTFVFADITGSDSVEDAVQLMGVTSISAEDIKADVGIV